jgi:hypothetical protein
MCPALSISYLWLRRLYSFAGSTLLAAGVSVYFTTRDPGPVPAKRGEPARLEAVRVSAAARGLLYSKISPEGSMSSALAGSKKVNSYNSDEHRSS